MAVGVGKATRALNHTSALWPLQRGPSTFAHVIDDRDYRRLKEGLTFLQTISPLLMPSLFSCLWLWNNPYFKQLFPPACVAVSFLIPRTVEVEKGCCISQLSPVSMQWKLMDWPTSTHWLPSPWRQLCLTRLRSQKQAPKHRRWKEGKVHPFNFRFTAQKMRSAISPLIVPVELKTKEFGGKDHLCPG